MLNILLVTDSYPPEIRSASHLMQELAEYLKQRGYEITVITTYPKYNLVEEFKDKTFEELTVENGINVIRVKTLSHHKVNFNYRGFAQLTMPFLFLLKGKKYFKKKFDVVIVYSPPLPLALVGKRIKDEHGAKFILNVQDIFPQNAIDLGILSNKILIKFFETIENGAYESADTITVHSQGNKDFLIQNKNASSSKVQIIHNWIDINLYKNIGNHRSFRKEYGLENKFIFLFAGVIGPAQELDLIIRAANRLKDIPEICFLFVGDGTKKDRAVELVKSYNLSNVIFEDFVSKENYPALVKECDVGLVCLSNKNKTPVVPGKILGYMSAAIPILAFLNKESDGHLIIKEAQCGYSCVSGNYKEASDLILKIFNEKDKLKEYGQNGYKYVLENFHKDVCLEKLEKLLISEKLNESKLYKYL